jgi:hypothetical protein
MLIEGDCSHIGVQCLLECLASGGTYETYDDSPFLDSGLFEHAWEFGPSDGFDSLHLGLMQTANNVRRTLFLS